MNKENDARYVAVRLLTKTFAGGSYSNIQLSSGLDNSSLDERGKKLCSAVYYGVIERRLTLDHIISGLSSRPLGKLDGTVLNILRAGIYQILYMDSVPDNAAVNESVKLAKMMGRTSASGMVNAILRSFIRNDKKYAVPESPSEAMQVRYSAPEWLVGGLTSDYGAELAEDLLSDSLGRPPVCVRRNNTRCTEEEFLSSLSCGAEPIEYVSCGYRLESGDVTGMDGFAKGFFHVQDIASQLCCMAVAPTEEDTVLDICAAPGGKTFTMAELMEDRGRIYAFDLHEKRVKLIREGAQRLGLENITAAAGDARIYDPDLPQFTKVLCDVPCSGIGAIRRKPEIKYKDPADFAGLPEIQYQIALNAARYLAPGGEMVYSTCTLRREENDAVVARLLESCPGLEAAKLPGVLGERFGSSAAIFPGYFGSDGFFIAKLKAAAGNK